MLTRYTARLFAGNQRLDFEESLDEAGHWIFACILEIASGARSCSEQLGFGEDELSPWQIGAAM